MLWSVPIWFVSFVFLFMSSLLCFVTGVNYLLGEVTQFVEWEVLSLNSVSITMTLLLDWMSLIFMSFVLLISSLVVYYSGEYMGGDINMNRFVLLVLMFVLSMMLLIISPNLISILLGWDGLGLVSYCLVIYYQNVKSYNAGMLTALSNRVGDVMLLLSIAWLANFGGFNYVMYLEVSKGSMEMGVIGVLVVVAAMTKSAQIPFSAWLPAAMAAPTPVSALVHSSTLVTAGVYLLIRFMPLLEGSLINTGLLFVGGLTMFMAGVGANFEFDLKKIIALSTLSQLGLMMSILGMGFLKLAYFHLLTHALFKALLFMCAGAVIHNMKDSQDIRGMGSMVTGMPATSACLNVANLALCGMPFLAGFYSKDLILEVASMGYLNVLSYFLFFFSTGLTVCYSMRLVYYSMSGDFYQGACNPLNDEGHMMLRGMSGLLVLSVVGGSTVGWLLFPTPEVVVLPPLLKLMAVIVSLGGGWLGYEIASAKVDQELYSLSGSASSTFLGSMWFMPFISTFGAIKGPLALGLLSVRCMDQGWSEKLGGQGAYGGLVAGSVYSQASLNNSLSVYLTTFMLWVVCLVVFMWV